MEENFNFSKFLDFFNVKKILKNKRRKKYIKTLNKHSSFVITSNSNFRENISKILYVNDKELNWLLEDSKFLKEVISKDNVSFLDFYSEEDKTKDFYKDFLSYFLQNNKNRFIYEHNIYTPETFEYKKCEILKKIHKEKEIFDINLLSEDLKKDQDILINALEYDKKVIKLLNFDYRDNKDIALSVAKNSPELLKDFKTEIRYSDDVVLRMLRYKPSEFENLPIEIKNNPGKILKFIQIVDEIYPFIDEKYKNPEFHKKMLLSNRMAVRHLKDEDQDIAFIKEHYKGFEFLLPYLHTSFRGNKEFVEKGVFQLSHTFKSISKDLRSDKNLCIRVLEKFVENYEYISDDLKDDDEMFNRFWDKNYIVFTNSSQRIKKNNYNLEKVIKKFPNEAKYIIDSITIDDDVLNNSEILKKIIPYKIDVVNKIPKYILEQSEIKEVIVSKFAAYIKRVNLFEKIYNDNNLKWSDLVETDESIIYNLERYMKINAEVIKNLPNDFKDKNFYMKYEKLITENKDVMNDDYLIVKRFKRENELNIIIQDQEKQVVSKRRKI